MPKHESCQALGVDHPGLIDVQHHPIWKSKYPNQNLNLPMLVAAEFEVTIRRSTVSANIWLLGLLERDEIDPQNI